MPPSPMLKNIPARDLITRKSSDEEKYLLFCSLFAGRADMHAKRFHSQKSGIVGYSPVCANEFTRGVCTKGDKHRKRVSCIDCENQAFTAITLDEFRAHIAGKSPYANDVLGTYAIDQDAMCSFIVADFDAKDKSSDKGLDQLRAAVITFMKVSMRFKVPTYLERSRSGKGFHVWLFFETSVSAKDARKLYSALLTLAMEQDPAINFDSYDRFIPYQDTVASNRFGNLIALPLQGKAGKEGNSVFLDENFDYYPDQWEFLSRIKRLSQTAFTEAFIMTSSASELGNLADDGLTKGNAHDTHGEPWEKKRLELPLTPDDVIGVLQIIKANMLHLEQEQLSTRAYNRIKRLAAYRNPEFYKAQKMRLDTHQIPRILSISSETEKYLSLPRGLIESLTRLLDDGNIAYEIVDKTQKGKKIHTSFEGLLRDKQPEAVQSLLSYDIGVLELPTGSGKTIAGINIIAEKSVSTLVIVDKDNLVAQWKEKLSEFLNITDEPPFYQTPTGREKRCPVIGEFSGKRKRRSELVDVATMQSLYRKGEVNDLVKDYGLVIVDECHHIPSYTYSSVLNAINAKHVYGLTATPERGDGHEMILYAECGPIRYRIDPLEQASKRSFDQFVVPRFTGSLIGNPDERFNLTKLYGELAEDDRRNELIVSDVLECINAGRNPLVLSERTEHVKELSRLIKAKFDNVISITGKMSAAAKRDFQSRVRSVCEDERFVIVSTGRYIGEGFDLDRLDTLFLTLPISGKTSVSQYTGRLHREHNKKTRVEVYDYVDVRIPSLERMYRKRLSSYKRIGYKIAPKGASTTICEDIIYGADEYMDSLLRDIKGATRETVLCSPHLQVDKAKNMASALAGFQDTTVTITVITSNPKTPGESAKKQRDRAVELLRKGGVSVQQEPSFNHQFVIIDNRIVWYGSMNFLGMNSADDSAIRIIDSELAIALKEQLRM